MKESYSEVLARHAGPNPTLMTVTSWVLQGIGVHTGPATQRVPGSEIRFVPCADLVQTWGRQHRHVRYGLARCGHGGVEDLAHVWKLQAREPGDPIGSSARGRGRLVNLTEDTANMYAGGKSDDFVVPSTRANKAAAAVAESVEERRSPKGSVVELLPMFRTLSRISHHLEWHDGHGR